METFDLMLERETEKQNRILSYQSLRTSTNNGYTTENRNGLIYHCLTQDMMISILKYHFTDNVKISMYVNGLPENHQFSDPEMPRHYNDFIELSYVLQGELSVIVDNETLTFAENELFLINPNVPYQELKNVSNAIVFNISMKSSFFTEMLLANIHENSLQGFLRNCLLQEKNSEKLLRFTPASTSVQKSISDLYSQILMEYKTKAPGYLFIIQGYFVRLLDYLVSNYQFTFTEDTKNTYKEYLFREVKKYMYAHYRDIQVKDLCDLFHYQGNFFNKLIQSFTGMSYSDYLIHIRVKIAGEMLKYTDHSTEEILEEVGYHNKGFFYKVFKDEYGMTPAAYRKSVKK